MGHTGEWQMEWAGGRIGESQNRHGPVIADDQRRTRGGR